MHQIVRIIGIAVVAATVGLSPVGTFAMGSSDSDSGEEKYKQAVSAVEKKDYVGAITLLKQVIDGDAKNADALNYLGYSYRKLGKYDRALTYYKRALTVKPDHKGANEYIGEAYLELKQPEMAKIHLDRLATICGPSCEEYQDLKKAFDAYKMKGKQS